MGFRKRPTAIHNRAHNPFWGIVGAIPEWYATPSYLETDVDANAMSAVVAMVVAPTCRTVVAAYARPDANGMKRSRHYRLDRRKEANHRQGRHANQYEFCKFHGIHLFFG